MLRLSKKADYALIAMKHLAQKAGGRSSTSAREIAEQYDIPIELMAKVLQRLVRTGLLVSTQGTRGGYLLGRASAAISVRRPSQSRRLKRSTYTRPLRRGCRPPSRARDRMMWHPTGSSTGVMETNTPPRT